MPPPPVSSRTRPKNAIRMMAGITIRIFFKTCNGREKTSHQMNTTAAPRNARECRKGEERSSSRPQSYVLHAASSRSACEIFSGIFLLAMRFFTTAGAWSQ